MIRHAKILTNSLHYILLQFNGQIDTVKYLIEERQCNPECQNVNKITPLFLASEKGHLDIIKYLTLEKCCDPTGTTGYCNTPLHIASANGHLEVVKFFISSLNCDPNRPGFARDNTFTLRYSEWKCTSCEIFG